MPYIFTSGKAAAGGGFEGHVYWMTPGTTTLNEYAFPADVQGMDIKPIILQYRNRAYIFAQFSQNLTVNEFNQLTTMGIKPPTTIPTLAAGSGSGGSTGNAIGFITQVHKVGPYVIHESNPGGATNAVSLTGQGRLWTGLPTTTLDPRVNFLRGYVSMDGAALARFAWERELGTTTVEENVSTAALGTAMSTSRGVPPYAHIAETYHERMWFVTPDHPTRVYFSEIGEPESVKATSFFETQEGEYITAMHHYYDQLVVFGRRVTYLLQGYTAADFVWRKIHPSIGCISRKAVKDIAGRLWFPSEDGVTIYDGGFTFAMKNLMSFWRDDYLANLAAYEDSEAGDDRFDHIYKLLIKKPSAPKSFYYIGHYENFEPSIGGTDSQPDWTFDLRDREDNAMGVLADVNSRRDQFYVGSCDSLIRKENVAANANDDGDTYNKAMAIQFRHEYLEKIGGQEGEGKVFTRLDLYAKAENQVLAVSLYSGEDDAENGVPQFSGSLPASALSGSVAKTRHHINPPNTVGEGLTILLEVDAPTDVAVSGYGGEWEPGPSNRPEAA